jgi:predicted DNA-binding protein
MEHTAPMKRTQIFLSPSQREKLAGRSERTGAPRAEIIRREIDQYLGGGPRPSVRRKR